MALKIDEQWVRQRVHLKHDNLDDVKSLSLPGSYHEKITHLGTSLHSFTRLKHLDLSRNSICNLEGIGHLHMLETLNLYYNNISTLKDLYLLRSLVNLKELDIRLNPVTKNEPDHRLFLVHMLPNLKKLDDRSVRDSERKAALMHFNTDQVRNYYVRQGFTRFMHNHAYMISLEKIVIEEPSAWQLFVNCTLVTTVIARWNEQLPKIWLWHF